MPPPDRLDFLVFAAHPDDAEFGCGGILALEAEAGRSVHLVIGSRGESGTHGSPNERTLEAEAAARQLGINIEFMELGGDAHMVSTLERQLMLAAIIRQRKPRTVLAPSPVATQHPDHLVISEMVRNACRLARYGGIRELRPAAAHSIDALFFYAITPEAELPGDPVLIDISSVLGQWTNAMAAHASQAASRDYIELQLARARVCGLRAGVSHATPLWPAEPLVAASLTAIARTARRF